MQLTLAKFINKWNGKYLDFDKFYGPQCVDLVQEWAKNFGYPPFWGNAKDIIRQAGNNYTLIKRAPLRRPKPGDVVIWGPPVGGGYGHCSIFISKPSRLSRIFLSLDQNWPYNSAVHPQPHTYHNVIGWLRPKKMVQPQIAKPPKKVFHIVKRGETLAKIASKYNTKWQNIYALNNRTIRNPNIIYPGQKLRVK